MADRTEPEPERGDADAVEVERYELSAPPAYRFEVDRRDFFRFLGAGLVVAFASPAWTQESGAGRRGSDAMPSDLSAWLHIGEDGRVTVFTGKAEMGQDIRTSLSQVVAEELRVGVASISLVMADTALTPFDMGTFGSRTTPIMAPQLRKVAAAAREMLLDLAAERWALERGALVVKTAAVVHPASGRTAGFGELSKGQKLVKTVTDAAPTTPPEKWTVAGQPLGKLNGRDIVTGRHKYTSDVARPGLVHGRVLRPPRIGATLVSADLRPAQAMAGVTAVRDGDFVGVTAANTHLAARALDAVRAEWKTTPQPSAAQLFDLLKKGGHEGDPRSRYVTGAVDDALAAAPTKLAATYTVAYIAHAPLEPRAAVAEWQDGALTVWTGTQRPFGVRGELAEAFRVPEDKVRVIVPDTGSGYGGKHTGEVAIEAARLARAASRPVKVVWTREEEFTWAYFRPAGVIDVRAAAGADGKLAAWEFHNYNSGPSGIRTPYEVAHQKIEFHPAASPLRQGSYRGLAATANHFARESHMDDLARALGLDPLEFRLRNLQDARLRAVLMAAAEKFGWAKLKSSPECGYGLACGIEKGGYVATCAEVSIAPAGGQVKVVRAVTAFECGAIVNPEALRNQIEGSVIMGLGGALFEAVDFADGEIANPRFSLYRVPRFGDAPLLETVLLDRKDLPSAGAGETPMVGIAPAAGNAIAAATGQRLRALPLAPKRVAL
ncbi:MAG: isoquinoline 1-oxidoreductase [Acidobacteria bacterium]|nr:MAG: isoquinoline 1-oxidoreductase [Acidobacteriota bacterium]